MEVVWLGIPLLIPMVWIVLSVFEVQRGVRGDLAVARAAGRAYALAPDDDSGQAAGDGRRGGRDGRPGPRRHPVALDVSCGNLADCHVGGAVITVRVETHVALPFVPDFLGGQTAFALDAEHDVPIGQYQERAVAVTAPHRPEAGQATILIVGLATVLAMGVAVVTDASAAYLQRQGLDNLADGAALAGADLGAAGDDVYTGGIGDDRLAITEAEARAAVQAYLLRAGAHTKYPGLKAYVSADAASQTVRCGSRRCCTSPLKVPGGQESALVSLPRVPRWWRSTRELLELLDPHVPDDQLLGREVGVVGGPQERAASRRRRRRFAVAVQAASSTAAQVADGSSWQVSTA